MLFYTQASLINRSTSVIIYSHWILFDLLKCFQNYLSLSGTNMKKPNLKPSWGEFESIVPKSASDGVSSPKVYKSETRSVFGSTELPVSVDEVRLGLKRERSSFTSSGDKAESPWNEHQLQLPRLPIPSLGDTLTRYILSLEAVVDPEAFFESKDIVEEFRDSDIAAMLQNDLHDFAEGLCSSKQGTPITEGAPEANGRPPSWLEPFWDSAYLLGRDPIPINVNYFFAFETDATVGANIQCRKAASLIHAAAEICLKIRYNTIELDFERNLPLCMSQLRRVFCTSRIPQIKRDKIVCFTPPSVTPFTFDEVESKTCEYTSASVAPQHMVVMVRNRMFTFRVLFEGGDDDEHKERVADVEDICATLVKISSIVSEGLPGCPIGIFTTSNRDEWATNYKRLQELDGGNSTNLEMVASALFVVCLDGYDVHTSNDHALQLLHGNGSNRWFDRHSLIVSANGEAGINFEHSVGDGITTLKVADMMFAANANRRWSGSVGAVLKFEELSWVVDDDLGKELRVQFDAFRVLIESNDTCALKFDRFGGNLIKTNKLSPDAFVQMAFQLTHYRLFGRIGATYEAASTRCFLHGRTETVRSATSAALDFCKVCSNEPVLDPKVGSKLPRPIDALRTAVSTHTENMRLAKGAQGVDRHLLGLKMMALRRKLKPIPRLFTDNSFTHSSHWRMSTSHCGSSALKLFGFGPVVGDGLGLGYMIKNDSISVVVTSKFTNRVTSSSVFCNMLESSLLHLKAILEAESEQRARAKSSVRNFYHPTNMNDVKFEDDGTFVFH